jgi:hypothetical protein
VVIFFLSFLLHTHPKAINMALISELLENQYFLQGIAVALLLVVVSNFYQELVAGFPYWHIPIVGRSRWEITNGKAKQRFLSSAKELIDQGFSQVGEKSYSICARNSHRGWQEADIGIRAGLSFK